MTTIYEINEDGIIKTHATDRDVIFVGRSKNNDIHIRDRRISRRHLRITIKEGKYAILDLQSKNGTFIEDMQLSPGIEMAVDAGIPVVIGKTAISIEKRPSKKSLTFFVSTDFEKRYETGPVVTQERRQSMDKNMALLHSTSSSLRSTSDLEKAAGRVLDHIMGSLNRIDRGFVFILDQKMGQVSETISRFREDLPQDKAYSAFVVARVIKDKKALIYPDIKTLDDETLSHNLNGLDIGSVMCFPLSGKRGLLGVLYLDSIKKPHGFRKGDFHLLSTICDQLVSAIQKA